MTMPTQPQRPTLSADERARLLDAEPHLRVVRGVLDDLESIGADVGADRDVLDRTETMRAGLIEKFSTQQLPSPPRNARKR